MKYGQIIKPEDVPAMMRDGRLEFGMELEFSNSDKFNPEYAIIQKDKFTGFSIRFGNGNFESEKYGNWDCARFPLPALKDGDPVIVSISNLPAIFAGWLNNEIQIYACGTNKWPNSGRRLDSVGVWHLPTKKELHEAGLDGWYDGRIELEE